MRRINLAAFIAATVCGALATLTGFVRAGTVASRVLGQPDFFHGAANTVDAASLAFSSAGSQQIGIAIDSAGRLYVADPSNNRVLGWHNVSALTFDAPADIVIGQTDFESSAAPSSPTATTLSNPHGVAVDAAGNLYVADTGASRVLVYPNPFTTKSQTGQFSGFAATIVIGQDGNLASKACNVGGSSPSADTLCSPDDVALDGNGNLYIADNANNRVVEYNGPIASSPIAANRVFGQLGSFTSNTANIGGSISKDGLKLPTGVAVDKFNNLYIDDFNNNRVLEYNTPLTVTSIAGSGDTSADQVWGQGGSFTVGSCGSVSATTLCFPLRIRLDASANLYIADTNNNRIAEYDEGANPPANLSANRIFGQPSATANVCNNPKLGANTLCGPTGMALDSAGELFAADGNNNRVLRYGTPLSSQTPNLALGEPDFTHTNETVDPSSLFTPRQLALNPDGAIVVADYGNNRVLGWRDAATFTNDQPADLVIGQPDFYSAGLHAASASTVGNPFGVAFDSNGNLYVADSSDNRVLEYNTPFAACAGMFPCVGGPANAVFGQPDFTSSECDGNASPSATTLCGPAQVAVDSLDNLYVADAGNNRVLEYNTPLDATAVAGSGDATADLVFGQGATGTGAAFTTSNCNRALSALTATSMCNPIGVGIDPQNNVYVADNTNSRVLEFDETVNSTTPPANVTANSVFGQDGSFTMNFEHTPAPDSLFMPNGVSFDSSGNLYVADQGNTRMIEFFTPMTVTATPGSGDTNADVVWGQGGDLYSDACSGATPATLCSPASAAIDDAGNLYISDQNNNRITAYVPPFPPPGATVAPNLPGILEVEPASIHFKTTAVGKHRRSSVTLTNTGPVPVAIGRITGVGDFSLMNGCPAQLLPQTSCDIQITFSPVTAGRRGGSIAIGDDANLSPHRIGLFGHAKHRGAR